MRNSPVGSGLSLVEAPIKAFDKAKLSQSTGSQVRTVLSFAAFQVVEMAEMVTCQEPTTIVTRSLQPLDGLAAGSVGMVGNCCFSC